MIKSNWDFPQTFQFSIDLPRTSESSIDPSDSLQVVYDPTGPIPFPNVDTPKSLYIDPLKTKGIVFDLDDKGQILSYVIPQKSFDKKNVQSILDKYGIVCQNVDSIEISVDEQNPNVHKITIDKYIF